MSGSVHLGYEVGSGAPVAIPLRHMVITGQTQEAGKTTALEALIERSGVKAVAFITKRGEGSFVGARAIRPYFREQADWQFVASILEASRGERLKFERAWIIRASKGAKTLADVQRNVRKAMETAKGMSADVYLTLDAYLDVVVPQIARVHWATSVELVPGLNVMDMTALPTEMQHLVVRSTIDWVLNSEKNTVVVIPEAWKFLPQGRGTPVKLAAEAYIRQAAGLQNYLWLDSQDIAGVEKIILKSVPVWILGVQRESNEVKRTLDQIPAGIKKPKLDAIATLGLGEFYACYGTHITKVYVQPAWMTIDQAVAVAKGAISAESRKQPTPTEVTVNEAQARELRETNERLQREVNQLRGELKDALAAVDSIQALKTRKGEPSPNPLPAAPPVSRVPVSEPWPHPSGDEEERYQRLVERFLREADRIVDDLLRQHPKLTVRTARPELDVELEREVIELDGSTTIGRVARLISEEFLESTRKFNEILREMERTGTRVNNRSLSVALKDLVVWGFLTKEGTEGYHAVPAMKVNIREVAAR